MDPPKDWLEIIRTHYTKTCKDYTL
jgi:hypothetical protein